MSDEESSTFSEASGVKTDTVEAEVPSNPRRNTMIPEGVLPSYLATAFGELYEEDGLMVMAKGLGWMSLLASFVRFYGDVEQGHLALLQEQDEDEQKLPSGHQTISKTKPPLVLVLGLRDVEHDALLSILESWGTPHHMMPKSITNESGQSKDRAIEYEKGGVFCVTSRILIVDLLSNVIRSQDIDGFLIAHGDQVSSESTEAFILRIYTSQKRRDEAFIKAFSDSPEGLVSGFSKIDKTLKQLHVRNLYLYPRFHDAVTSELENGWDVEELQQSLSPLMKEIQSSIVAALQTCMKELKSLTSALVEWTGEELSIENCAMPNFHKSVKRQLEKEWHRLKPQTKQLVEDLRVLGSLFQKLIQDDCVRFWMILNNIKSNSAGARHPSMWLLTPSAERLFKTAKARIYKIEAGKPTASVPKPVSRLVPVLEENPKWRLLKTILTEIKEKEEAKKKDQTALAPPTTILVMVKDSSTLRSLRQYLVEGRDRALANKFHDYLSHYNDRRRYIADGKNMSEESRLLYEEESRVARVVKVNRKVAAAQQKKTDTSNKKKRSINSVPSYMRKRRRIALERGRGEATGGQEDRERQAVLDEAIEKAEHDLGVDDSEDFTAEQDAEARDDAIYNNMFQPSFPDGMRVVLRSFTAFDGDPTMTISDLDPSYVIMYDMDVSLIRALEVYAAVNGRDATSDRLKLYLLSFEASSEQKVFHKSLEREQAAFVKLIHHKQTMPPPVLRVEGTQEMQQAMATGIVNTYAGGTLPLSMDTRRGQGKHIKGKDKRDVVVDVREFRSALPSILHQGGMRLAPATLTVGDFVLSNVHCVERKSISDLYGSFASGRLYTQAEAMSKYYKVPILLIEFDPNKSFCLQNANEIGLDIRQDAISSKLVLLTRAFPKLRILWSKTPHETLKIFQDLKVNHDEVDVEKSIEVGREDSIEAMFEAEKIASKTACEGDDDDDVDEINESARNMLLRLPGVNVQIAKKIMNECDSLAELIEMPRTDLRRIAGPIVGQKLFTFFHQPYASTT